MHFHHKTTQTTYWGLVGRLQQVSQRRHSVTQNEIIAGNLCPLAGHHRSGVTGRKREESRVWVSLEKWSPVKHDLPGWGSCPHLVRWRWGEGENFYQPAASWRALVSWSWQITQYPLILVSLKYMNSWTCHWISSVSVQAVPVFFWLG